MFRILHNLIFITGFYDKNKKIGYLRTNDSLQKIRKYFLNVLLQKGPYCKHFLKQTFIYYNFKNNGNIQHFNEQE